MSSSVVSALREACMVTWKGTVHQLGREGDGERISAEMMRHRSRGNCRTSGETIHLGHMGTGGHMKVGLLPPAFPPTAAPVSIVGQIWNQLL